MAFLIPVTGEVKLISRKSRYCDHLGGYFEMLPFHLQFDKIEGSNSKIYQYVILMDEEGKLKNLAINPRAIGCASLDFSDSRKCKNLIFGPCILEPYDEDEEYTWDDWTAIREGTFTDTSLVAKNLKGKHATERYEEY
jgi:hypothetical protein